MQWASVENFNHFDDKFLQFKYDVHPDSELDLDRELSKYPKKLNSPGFISDK